MTVNYSVINVTSISLFFPTLRDHCRCRIGSIVTSRSGTWLRENSDARTSLADAHVNSEQVNKNARDLYKSKTDKISAWRMEISMKSHL